MLVGEDRVGEGDVLAREPVERSTCADGGRGLEAAGLVLRHRAAHGLEEDGGGRRASWQCHGGEDSEGGQDWRGAARREIRDAVSLP